MQLSAGGSEQKKQFFTFFLLFLSFYRTDPLVKLALSEEYLTTVFFVVCIFLTRMEYGDLQNAYRLNLYFSPNAVKYRAEKNSVIRMFRHYSAKT